jgi:TctA family transporter
MFAFGLIGYGMILADLDRGLLLLAFVLGGRLEENVGRVLLIWRGDATVFLRQPISAAFLLAGVALLVGARIWRHRRRGDRGRPPVEAVGAMSP